MIAAKVPVRANRTMGVISLALIAASEIDVTKQAAIPLWVKISAAVAIAPGTYLDGWRIMRTLGKGIVDINAPQGFPGDTSIASVILASSGLGFALSTHTSPPAQSGRLHTLATHRPSTGWSRQVSTWKPVSPEPTPDATVTASARPQRSRPGFLGGLVYIGFVRMPGRCAVCRGAVFVLTA